MPPERGWCKMSGMHPLRARLPPILVLAGALVLAIPPAASQEDGTVTIYHCADEDGRPVVRDSPCAPGQAQRRVSTMQRPVDPPPRPDRPQEPAVPDGPPPAQAPQPARPLVVRTPTPMYECTTPDGATYTSDDGSGNPRWVPLWTLGYGYGYGRGYDAPRRHLPPPRQRPPIGAPVRPAAAGSTRGSAVGSGFRFDGVGRPSPRLPADQPRDPPRTGPGGHGRGRVPYAAGGTWVQDDCRALPQAEVCQVLRDRSWTLRQRFNHALQGEQREITAERRRIAQRLASDC